LQRANASVELERARRSRLAGAQRGVEVDKVIEMSIAHGRSPADFAWIEPGFRSLSMNATDEVRANPKLERAGNS